MEDKGTLLWSYTLLSFSSMTINVVTNQLNAACSWHNWQIQRALITAIFFSILTAVNSSSQTNAESEIRVRGGKNTFESFTSKSGKDLTKMQRPKRP